ncbi:hypothetical protein [Patulibacter americanus]|uniref:hypothetical protein n=1 Tax=Patulibacter americanus TaxID=588672 RepID=UPI0003B4C3F7|nr:hypothetical protein [Patulibacter americanus]
MLTRRTAVPARPALTRLRIAAATVATAGVLVVALGPDTTVPAASAASTVCQNADPAQGRFSTPVRARGRLLGRVWVHADRGGGSCTVLRAVAYRGTPHYMSLQVCESVTGPSKDRLRGVGCSGVDAGKYSRYAGPIVHHRRYCQAIRVMIDVPGGRRLTDQWVFGPCD